MKMKTLLSVVALLLITVEANIVELNGFRLAPYLLVKKQDFTYGSGDMEQDYSAIKFDLSLTPMNTKPQQDYALMILTAN